MKLNFEKNPGNKKQAEKIEQQKRELHSNTIRHADYEAQLKNNQAPFGKTFKTGGHVDKKKELKKGKEKHKRRMFD